MKNITKTLLILFVSVLMVLSNSVQVFAIPASQVNSERAYVTVEEVEPGTVLKLYKIVEPDIDPSTSELKGYKFTTKAAAVLADPDELIDLTLTDNSKNYTIQMKADDLDVDGDGLIDEKIVLADVSATAEGESAPDTLANKEWTISTTKKAIYDMEAPTNNSINLAISNGALGDNADEEGTAATGKTYVQIYALTGQYIGILVPPADSDISYNPVVLSVGYRDLDVYKTASAAEMANQNLIKFYRKKDGTFTDAKPTEANKHLYYTPWDSDIEADPTYVKDGTTTAERLIAGNVDPAKDYSIPQQATTALAKRSITDFKKDVKTDYPEEGKPVALVATLKNGDPKYVFNQTKPTASDDNPDPDTVQLVYVKAPFIGEQYNNVRDGSKYYKLVNGVVEETTADDDEKVVLADMETLDAHKAQTVNKDVVYSVSQGERIDYELTPTIPQYPANAKNKTLTFTDRMGEGISFVHGSIEIDFETSQKVIKSYNIDGNPQYRFYIYTNKKYDPDVNSDGKYFYDETEEIWKQINSTATTPVVPNPNDEIYDLLAEAKEVKKDGTLVGTAPDQNTFQINFKYDALPGTEGAKQSPSITYKAVLNEKAICGISGNVNVAKMFFSKNSGEGSSWENWDQPSGRYNKELHDEGKVYTYEIKFRKTNDKEEFIKHEGSPALDANSADTLYLLKQTATNQAVWDELKAAATTWYVVNDANEIEAFGYLVPGDVLGSDAAKRAEVGTDQYKKNPAFEVLKDVEFGLYKTSECLDKDLITKIKTNSHGLGHTTLVHGNDTYYLKEIKAPQGYSLNSKVYDVTPTWTSASTWSTDSVTRYVYTVVTYNDYNNNQHTHTGWLVADEETSTNGKYYDMNGNNPDTSSNTEVDGRYFGHGTGDGTNAWRYDYSTKTMTKGNVVVKYVFPAIASEFTSTTKTEKDTVYNNNGGTLYLARINNTKTPELPSTGGIGTYLFTIAGVAIIATAAFMLIFQRKENH